MLEEDEVKEKECRLYEYYEQVNVSKIHHFYISQVVDNPIHYIHMINIIMSASPVDIIHLHLNTPGGVLETGIQIINAMRSTEAHVVCSLEARAYSLGTLIFLAAAEFIVHDNCVMMFHNYSGGTSGKGHEQEAELSATRQWFTSFAHDLYVPFLNEEEFENIINGGDLWIHSDEIRTRLSNMVNIIEKEQQEEQLTKASKKKASKKKASKKK